MANVPSSGDHDTQVDAVKRMSLGMRVVVWACLMTLLLLVFLGYRQMDLLIAWLTATLC